MAQHLDPQRFPFDDAQQHLAAGAADDLGDPLELAVIAVGNLADALRHVDPPPAPTDVAQRTSAAIYGLGVLGVRTARALMLLVANGWEPEAHALKRRLTEATLRAQHILEDESGEAARQWLESRAVSAGSLFQKYRAATPWSVLSAGSHADVRSLRLSTSPSPWEPPPSAQSTATVLPERSVIHAQGLLLEVGWEAGLLLAGLVESIDGTVLFDGAYVDRVSAARDAYEAQWLRRRSSRGDSGD